MDDHTTRLAISDMMSRAASDVDKTEPWRAVRQAANSLDADSRDVFMAALESELRRAGWGPAR